MKIVLLAAATSMLLATSMAYAQEPAAAAAMRSGPMTTSMSKTTAHRHMMAGHFRARSHHRMHGHMHMMDRHLMNSTRSLENGTASGKGSGPKGGSPNGN
jgi:hypothetical protein